MSTTKIKNPITRMVGLTNCTAGFNDLCPVNVEPRTRWWEVYEDFSAQSFHPYPAVSSDCPAWSAAYRAKDDKGREREFSDLMVIDLHGCSANHAFRWITRNNLEGLAHSTRSDMLDNPRSRVILLLDRPVISRTYRLLWDRLTQEVFPSLANPAHGDFRQRYNQPRAVRNQSTLLRHEGNLLSVDGALAESFLAGDTLGLVCQAHASEGWPGSFPPRNR